MERKRGQATFRGTFFGQEVEECRVVVLIMKDGSTAVLPIEHMVGMADHVSVRNTNQRGRTLRQPGVGT